MWCSVADTLLKPLDRVVSGASVLAGVCLSVTLHIVDLWQYYVWCTRSDVTRCTLRVINTGFHSYRFDKTGGGVSVFIRNCNTSTHVANFSVGLAYREISVLKISLSNNCTITSLVFTDHRTNKKFPSVQ